MPSNPLEHSDMAKIKSIIHIVGTIKGITYYYLNGQYVARRANPPTKDQIYNDPRFASVRANTKEFGGASILSKAIRKGLGENEKLFKDTRFSGRLTGACRVIIQKGSGKPGEREAHLVNMPDALKGFQLQKFQIFNRIFPITPVITTTANNQLITISIPKVNLIRSKRIPAKATHFRLIAAISTVSSHKWHRRSKKYQPKWRKANALGAMCITEPLMCNWEHQNINLVVENPIKQRPFQFSKIIPFFRAPSNPMAITIWLGITFGNMEGDSYKLQRKPKAMECIAVI